MRRNPSRPASGLSPAGRPGLIPLSALNAGEHGVVSKLAGGHCLLGRMTALGFTPGAEVTVVQNFGRGPIIARVRDSRIALGRGEAGRILVRRG